MAFTLVNVPVNYVPNVTRGHSTLLGSLAANNQAVAFTVPQVNASPNGNDYLVISMAGTAIVGLVAILEMSIDGGNSWFVNPPIASTLTITGTSDTAAQFVGAYLLYGTNGVIYRFGATTFTSGGPGTVWAYLS